MTFTRLSTSTALSPAPVIVFGPFASEREVRNIARELLHDSATRSTFVPAGPRQGEFRLLYNSHAEAKTALTFFASASLYTYNVADASLDTRFIVWGGNLRVIQNNPKWELIVPYKEIPA